MSNMSSWKELVDELRGEPNLLSVPGLIPPNVSEAAEKFVLHVLTTAEIGLGTDFTTELPRRALDEAVQALGTLAAVYGLAIAAGDRQRGETKG